MQIQPAISSNYTSSSYGSVGTLDTVGQEIPRTDIPPVEETERAAGAQNRLFSSLANIESPRKEPGSTSEASREPKQAQADESVADEDRSSESNGKSDRAAIQQLSEQDQALLEQLKARDREVRVHEAAHASVGGQYAGSPTFEYARGPDGKNYATGGEVSISVSAVAGDPQATIEKARVIRAAALAPAEPSAQDRRVAAEAGQLELAARAELQALKSEQSEEGQQGERAEENEQSQAQAEEVVEEATEKADTGVADDRYQPEVQVQSVEVQAESESESGSNSSNESERTNARQDLEKILLATGSILQQAGQLGLVDPQNPYGKSGFLDVIA